MASQIEEHPGPSHTPSQSFSPGSVPKPDKDVEPASFPVPTQLTKRSSSVRFREDTFNRSSEMPDRNRSGDVDEVTPIRRADGHVGRKYNTTEESVNAGTSSAKPATPVNSESETKEEPSWFRRVAEKYGSVTLENKGSVARDHLALERTFLAWLRTSLAFASIGIAVTQLFRLNTSIQRPNQSFAASQLSLLPLSPLLGHGLSPELIPLLQQLAYSAAPNLPSSAAQNTLLDQLLLMHSMAEATSMPPIGSLAFDEHAATRLRRVGKPLGATFLGISIIVLLVGFHRYFEAQFWIIRGKFPASRGSIALTGTIAGALIVASLVVVLAVSSSSYEKR